jgi:hypothetical protein
MGAPRAHGTWQPAPAGIIGSYVVRSVQLDDRSIISARRGVWRWPAAIEQCRKVVLRLHHPFPAVRSTASTQPAGDVKPNGWRPWPDTSHMLGTARYRPVRRARHSLLPSHSVVEFNRDASVYSFCLFPFYFQEEFDGHKSFLEGERRTENVDQRG